MTTVPAVPPQGGMEKMLAPFEKSERVAVPGAGDHRRAGLALAALRREGWMLKNPRGALLDALQAADAARWGALLVTRNIDDFQKLARHLPLRVASFDDFRRSLLVFRLFSEKRRIS